MSDILAKIDINSDPGGVIILDPNQVSHEALIHTAGIKHIETRLTEERNRLLDLNELHTQMGIRFRFVSIEVADPVVMSDPRARVTPQELETDGISRSIRSSRSARKTKNSATPKPIK